MSTIACQNCGEEFTPTRSDARYCSDRCRKAAARSRERAKPPRCPECDGLGWVEVIYEGEHDGMLPCGTCRPERRRYIQARVRRVEAEHEARGGGS